MAAPRAIDMHAHYYGGLVDDLLQRDERPFVSRNASGALVLNAMTASTVMSAGYTDLAARLAWMDANRIATQLLTFPGALGVDVMPVAAVAGAIARYNGHLADVCRASAGRFIGLAGLPLADMALAARELLRARRELGLAGVILPGNYFLTEQDARRLEPVFAAADATRALVMIHPGLMPGEAPPASYSDNAVMRASAINLQATLAHMGMTVVGAGLAERYPRATFQLVNLGGTLPFIVERMEAVASSREPRLDFQRSDLRGMVYDCASLGPRALELAVRIFGPDRIMLGTDYPIFYHDQVGDTLAAAAISNADRALVCHGTAAAVFERVFG